MQFYDRRSWGARPPRTQYRTFADSKYVGMEAHHTVTPASWSWDVTARQIQNMHLDQKRWTDVFYAFGLPASGGVVELRGWNRAQGNENTWDPDGTGNLPKGYLMPVVFFGDYRTDVVTPAQRDAWRWLRQQLLKRNPTATAQRWHNMRASTFCPGPPVEEFVRANWSYVPPRDPSPGPVVSEVPDLFQEEGMLHVRHDTTKGWYWSIDPSAPNPIKEIDDPGAAFAKEVTQGSIHIQRSPSMRYLMRDHWGVTHYKQEKI